MAGAMLFFLNCLRDLAIELFSNGIDSGGDLVTLVADNDYEVLRVESPSGMERMAEQ